MRLLLSRRSRRGPPLPFAPPETHHDRVVVTAAWTPHGLSESALFFEPESTKAADGAQIARPGIELHAPQVQSVKEVPGQETERFSPWPLPQRSFSPMVIPTTTDRTTGSMSR